MEAGGTIQPGHEALDAFLAPILRGRLAAWPQEWSCALAIWERIEFHGIALLLAEQPQLLANWPQDLRDAIRDEAQMQVFWEESHKGAIAPLIAQLARSGIAARVMKGTALAYSVHANAAARRRGDTDLLVQPADLAATRQILQSAGQSAGFTRRDDPHGVFFQETWLFDTGFGMIHAVDLHWQPNDSPALQKVLRLEEYFAGGEVLHRLDPAAMAPARVLTFVQGAINQAWHRAKGYFVGEDRVMNGHRLIWSLDNHLLASDFTADDWTRLVALGTERDMAGIVLTALEAARRDLGSDVPPEVLAALAAAPQETALSRYLTQTDQAREFLTDLRASVGVRAKLRFLAANAFPARRHLHWKYPGSTRWPLPLLHLRRILELALRAATVKAR